MQNKRKTYPNGTTISQQLYYLQQEQTFAIKNPFILWKKDEPPEGCFKKIKLEDVVYIESDRDYALIYTADGNCNRVLATLKKISEVIVVGFLFQVHKSFIVNICYTSLNEKLKPSYADLKVDFRGTIITVPVGKQFIERNDLLFMLGFHKSNTRIEFLQEFDEVLVQDAARIERRLLQEDIALFKSKKDYVNLMLWSGDEIRIHVTLGEIQRQLKGSVLVQVNRTQIINSLYANYNKRDGLILHRQDSQISSRKINLGRKYVGIFVQKRKQM